ncbi:MAG: Gfo/Idh/MocA family oxidoreductase [Candidatus Poribacteria bacterium]|nr:Gfo/Idh/MocA family oxidoreductase [Candidatus Poribacteria bacterium]
MSDKQVRLAVIGCGGIANAHLRGYKTLVEKGVDTFSIDATCDVRKEAAQNFAEEIAAFQGSTPRVYDDVEEMLKAEDLDGADICTPHSHHHISAIPCLESGVDIMTEKPFGVTIKASKKMIEVAQKHGRITATAENCRRTPGQRTVRWALNEGNIVGKPRMFFAQSAGWRDPSEVGNWHWRLGKEFSGGGMVMDSGAHMMDTIRYFFGDVEKVYAEVRQIDGRFANHVEKGKVPSCHEDTWVAVITFKSGVVGTWSWTIAAPAHPFLNVAFYGDGGVIRDYGDVFHPFTTKDRGDVEKLDGTKYAMSELREMYLETLSADEKEWLFPFGIEDGFALEIYDFINAIKDGRPPEVDGSTGLQAKATSIAIYESGYSGEVVTIADVLDGTVNGYQQEIDARWGL